MQNPWINLPQDGELILPEDREALDKTLLRNGRNYKHNLQLEVYPEPYLGSPASAQIVVLCLNPGFVESDLTDHKENYLKQQSQASLVHQSLCPFYLLDPKLAHTGGYKWWSKRLRYVIQDASQKKVAEKVMAIEWFPYHSVSFKRLPQKRVLPSQKYGFSLVKNAIDQKKDIVIMRSKKRWIESVPELEDYKCIELPNPRSPYFSRNQMQKHYDRLLALIQS